MRRSSHTAVLQLTAILNSLVALSSGASIPRSADSTCTYPTGKFGLGNSMYLGLDDILNVFVATDAAHAVPLQLNYCGNATGASNTFEIAVTDGKGTTLGLLGVAGNVTQIVPAWGSDSLLLAIVDHTVAPQIGIYNNTAIPALEGLYTASQIWVYDPEKSAPYLNANVAMAVPNSVFLSAAHYTNAVATVNGYSLDSESGTVSPLFLSGMFSNMASSVSQNLTWVQDPPPPPPTLPSPPPPTVSEGGQCGGAGHGGPTQCSSGLACVQIPFFPGHSLCLTLDATSCPSSINGTQNPLDQCGSSGTQHRQQCKPGNVCISTDIVGSRCLQLDAHSTAPC